MIVAWVVNPGTAATDEPQTTADILPANACQPCHETVPKLKLLPRHVKTLFKGQHTTSSLPDLVDKILQQMPAAPPK